MQIILMKIIQTFSGKTCAFLAFGIIIFSFFFGSITLFPGSKIAWSMSSLTQILIACGLLLVSYRESKKDPKFASQLAALFLTFYYLLSDVTIRKSSYLGEYFPFVQYFLVSIIIYLIFKRNAKPIIFLLSICCVLTGAITLYLTSGGNLIFTDDHPSFLYRLIQLKEHFPNIPFYNPEWNAGVEAREFFASGALNVFFILSPLIYLFEVENLYTFLIIIILFGLLPISLFWAGKNFKLSSLEIVILICLGLTHSIYWYRWSLSYGTLGFIVAMTLVPLNLSFFRLLLDDKTKISFPHIITIAFSLSLMLLWSLSGLLFLTIGILALYYLRNSIIRTRAIMLLVLLTALNLPWISVFFKVSNVGDFISGGAPQTQSSFDKAKFKTTSMRIQNKPFANQILYTIRKNVLPVSPLVLFFGVSGLFFHNDRKSRALLSAFCFGAAGLGFIASIFKPHLELDRMILPLSLILCFPAASLIGSTVTKHKNKFISSLLISLLLFSPVWIHRVLSNNSSEKFAIERPLVKNLAAAIKLNANGGRTLFSGFSLHELSGGHLAPLPYWTDTPLIASSYQHDKWNYVDVIPEIYRKQKEAGVLEYLHLHNVSLVASNNKFWRKWFRARPEIFTEIWKEDGFVLFKLNNFNSNYFLEGKGEILSQDNGKVRLNIFSESAVLKFNYLPFLKSTNCTISPQIIGDTLNFISLSNCSRAGEVVISSKNVFERFF